MLDVAARFGENLARCRKLAGLSQEEVSIRASLHRTEISQLERALRIPRIDTVIKLATVLEVSVLDLLDGIAWEAGGLRQGSFKPADPEAER